MPLVKLDLINYPGHTKSEGTMMLETHPIPHDYSLSYYDWLDYWKNYLGFEIVRARDVMNDNFEKQPNKYYLVIRHDLDSITYNGDVLRKMIDIEESLGIYTSYYPIVDQKNYGYFKKYTELFREIEDRGHEIGLHVNSAELCHTPTWVSRTKSGAFEQFERDVQTMRNTGFDLRTMCYHGNIGEYLNRELVEEYPYNKLTPRSFKKFFPNDVSIFNDSSTVIAVSTQAPFLPKRDYKTMTVDDPFGIKKAQRAVLPSAGYWNYICYDNMSFVVNHPEHYVIDNNKLIFKGKTHFFLEDIFSTPWEHHIVKS